MKKDDLKIVYKSIAAPDFKIEIGEICKVKDVFSAEGNPFLILIEPERKRTNESMRVLTIVDKFKKIEKK